MRTHRPVPYCDTIKEYTRIPESDQSDCLSYHAEGAEPAAKAAGKSVINEISGGQFILIGNGGDTPIPGVTCSHVSVGRCSPRARRLGIRSWAHKQPKYGHRICPPWVCPDNRRSTLPGGSRKTVEG